MSDLKFGKNGALKQLKICQFQKYGVFIPDNDGFLQH